MGASPQRWCPRPWPQERFLGFFGEVYLVLGLEVSSCVQRHRKADSVKEIP